MATKVDTKALKATITELRKDAKTKRSAANKAEHYAVRAEGALEKAEQKLAAATA